MFSIVAMVTQQALASRLKDIEMFSAGIAQQIIKREEKLHRTKVHLQKGTSFNYFV